MSTSASKSTSVQKLATIRDLAAFLQLDDKTVTAQWRKKMGIPEYRLTGKILRFDLREVQEHLRRSIRKEVAE